jgi:hypothetical protein
MVSLNKTFFNEISMNRAICPLEAQKRNSNFLEISLTDFDYV